MSAIEWKQTYDPNPPRDSDFDDAELVAARENLGGRAGIPRLDEVH